MRKAIVFLDQQSWPGGAQRILEATLDSVSPEYDCIAAFPDSGPFRSSLAQRNLETIDLPIGNYESGKKSLREMAKFACLGLYCGLKLALFVRKREIALIYINGPRCLLAGTLAGWLTRRPAVFHLHLVLKRRPEIILTRALSRFVSKILACSNAAAASLVGHHRWLEEKIEVVYNPVRKTAVSRSSIEQSNAKDHCTIGIVARITECKGHHLLLEAVAGLPPELRDKVRILVVGSEAPGSDADLQYSRRLREQARRYGIDKQITWAGYQDDLDPLYGLMDVLVQPALPETWAEAMSLAILEALDRGVPVIAARDGGNPEVVRDGFNGLLVAIDDKTGLCRALAAFVRDRRFREQLKHGAHRRLDQRFSMETFSSRIQATIAELCPVGNKGELRLKPTTD